MKPLPFSRAKLPLLAALLLILPLVPLHAYRILYAEEYYRLFHEQLYHYPEDCLENIVYLEDALNAPFANPLYALAKINNKLQWERYRYLFKMHMYLLLIGQYRLLASDYDKRVAYFYNYPWKKQNLESLKTAEEFYKKALSFWPEAVYWSSRAARLSIVQLPAIQDWADESYRIQTGELNYARYLEMDLARVRHVRQVFEQMGPSTY